MSDRYWDDNGQPYLFEGEEIEYSVSGVKIGGTYQSKNELEIEDLKEGELYITSNRVLFIGKVRDSQKTRENYDGISIFLQDIESLKSEKKKFSVLCNIRSGKKGKRARIYFKELEGEMKEKIEAYINKVVVNLKEPTSGTKPIEKKIDKKAEKKAKKKQEKMDARDRKIKGLFDEADEDAFELVCPACGADVLYKPGMKICPVCSKKVNFI